MISSGSRAKQQKVHDRNAPGDDGRLSSGQGPQIRIFLLTCGGAAGSRSMTAHGGVGLAHASDRPDSHRTSTDRGDQWRRLGPRNTRGPTCIPGSRGSRGWPASLAAGTMGACVAHSLGSPSPRRWRLLASPLASPAARRRPSSRRRLAPRWHPRVHRQRPIARQQRWRSSRRNPRARRRRRSSRRRLRARRRSGQCRSPRRRVLRP